MSFPHEVIEIDSDDEEDEVMNRQLMRYLSTRAADLAAAGITEGELEVELQRAEGRQDRRHQARDRRRRHQDFDSDEDNGHSRLNSPPPLPPPEVRNRRGRYDNFIDRDEDHGHGRLGRPPPQLQPRPAPRAPPPQTPPRQKPKSRIPKPTPKSTPRPKGKAKREPDDMTVDATCIICYNAITNTVLIPCGHLVLCKVCCDAIGATEKKVPGPKTARCPICRELVLDRMLIYRC